MHEIKLWPVHNSGKFSLRNSLFETVKLIKNTYLDKYYYFWMWYYIWYMRNFFIKKGGFGKNMIIFGVDTSSLFNFDKEKTGILFLGKGVTEGLDDTTLNDDAEFYWTWTKIFFKSTL